MEVVVTTDFESDPRFEDDLRFAVPEIARQLEVPPSRIRDAVCGVLLRAPDRNNWSEYPNIWDEVRGHLSECPLPKVYTIAEAIYASERAVALPYEARLNEFFEERRAGRRMKGGRIEETGDQ